MNNYLSLVNMATAAGRDADPNDTNGNLLNALSDAINVRRKSVGSVPVAPKTPAPRPNPNIVPVMPPQQLPPPPNFHSNGLVNGDGYGPIQTDTLISRDPVSGHPLRNFYPHRDPLPQETVPTIIPPGVSRMATGYQQMIPGFTAPQNPMTSVVPQVPDSPPDTRKPIQLPPTHEHMAYPPKPPVAPPPAPPEEVDPDISISTAIENGDRSNQRIVKASSGGAQLQALKIRRLLDNPPKDANGQTIKQTQDALQDEQEEMLGQIGSTPVQDKIDSWNNAPYQDTPASPDGKTKAMTAEQHRETALGEIIRQYKSQGSRPISIGNNQTIRGRTAANLAETYYILTYGHRPPFK